MSSLKKTRRIRNIEDLSMSELKSLLQRMGMSLDRKNHPKKYYVNLYRSKTKQKHKITRNETSFACSQSKTTNRKRKRSKINQKEQKFKLAQSTQDEENNDTECKNESKNESENENEDSTPPKEPEMKKKKQLHLNKKNPFLINNDEPKETFVGKVIEKIEELEGKEGKKKGKRIIDQSIISIPKGEKEEKVHDLKNNIVPLNFGKHSKIAEIKIIKDQSINLKLPEDAHPLNQDQVHTAKKAIEETPSFGKPFSFKNISSSSFKNYTNILTEKTLEKNRNGKEISLEEDGNENENGFNEEKFYDFQKDIRGVEINQIFPKKSVLKKSFITTSISEGQKTPKATPSLHEVIGEYILEKTEKKKKELTGLSSCKISEAPVKKEVFIKKEDTFSNDGIINSKICRLEDINDQSKKDAFPKISLSQIKTSKEITRTPSIKNFLIPEKSPYADKEKTININLNVFPLVRPQPQRNEMEVEEEDKNLTEIQKMRIKKFEKNYQSTQNITQSINSSQNTQGQTTFIHMSDLHESQPSSEILKGAVPKGTTKTQEIKLKVETQRPEKKLENKPESKPENKPEKKLEKKLEKKIEKKIEKKPESNADILEKRILYFSQPQPKEYNKKRSSSNPQLRNYPRSNSYRQSKEFQLSSENPQKELYSRGNYRANREFELHKHLKIAHPKKQSYKSDEAMELHDEKLDYLENSSEDHHSDHAVYGHSERNDFSEGKESPSCINENDIQRSIQDVSIQFPSRSRVKRRRAFSKISFKPFLFISIIISVLFILYFTLSEVSSIRMSDVNLAVLVALSLLIVIIGIVIIKRKLNEKYYLIASEDYLFLKEEIHKEYLRKSSLRMSEFIRRILQHHPSLTESEYKKYVLPMLRKMIKDDVFIIEDVDEFDKEKVTWREI